MLCKKKNNQIEGIPVYYKKSSLHWMQTAYSHSDLLFKSGSVNIFRHLPHGRAPIFQAGFQPRDLRL